MINFSFNINWPWFKDNDSLAKDYFYKSWRVTEHKTLEIQLSKGSDTLIGGSFYWNIRCDHAGLQLTIDLFCRYLHISLVDNRHWDYENNRYETYEDT